MAGKGAATPAAGDASDAPALGKVVAPTCDGKLDDKRCGKRFVKEECFEAGPVGVATQGKCPVMCGTCREPLATTSQPPTTANSKSGASGNPAAGGRQQPDGGQTEPHPVADDAVDSGAGAEGGSSSSTGACRRGPRG